MCACHHRIHIFKTSFAYLFWLANNNKGITSIQSSVWATVMKLFVWGVVGRSTTDNPNMACHHQMCILSTPFAYLFWLAKNNKGITSIQSSVLAWWNLVCGRVVVGRSTADNPNVVCHHQMCIWSTSFAYQFWLASNNKVKYFKSSVSKATVMKLGMWVVVGRSTTDWSVVTECAYWIPHLQICSGWLITTKANIQSSVSRATVTKLGMWVVVGISIPHMCLSSPNAHIKYLVPHLHIFWKVNVNIISYFLMLAAFCIDWRILFKTKPIIIVLFHFFLFISTF